MHDSPSVTAVHSTQPNCRVTLQALCQLLQKASDMSASPAVSSNQGQRLSWDAAGAVALHALSSSTGRHATAVAQGGRGSSTCGSVWRRKGGQGVQCESAERRVQRSAGPGQPGIGEGRCRGTKELGKGVVKCGEQRGEMQVEGCCSALARPAGTVEGERVRVVHTRHMCGRGQARPRRTATRPLRGSPPEARPLLLCPRRRQPPPRAGTRGRPAAAARRPTPSEAPTRSCAQSGR